MDAEIIAKLRQEYRDELKEYCKGVHYGCYPTEKEFDYLMSLISDELILDEVESGTPHKRSIEELVYYNIICLG